ncbi:hypothetical protein BC937DRAFT_93640 [Endogone sp. FLAS-F59071]|nr:hypothetical protein BC937DRAFT_93640 [Endogone sp. FLAS-F59071]|eukprot:RUS14557.1 hypothetical protein BC937DRAFT_93640 [Endogone sp. FLAS-F59071]
MWPKQRAKPKKTLMALHHVCGHDVTSPSREYQNNKTNSLNQTIYLPMPPKKKTTAAQPKISKSKATKAKSTEVQDPIEGDSNVKAPAKTKEKSTGKGRKKAVEKMVDKNVAAAVEEMPDTVLVVKEANEGDVTAAEKAPKGSTVAEDVVVEDAVAEDAMVTEDAAVAEDITVAEDVPTEDVKTGPPEDTKNKGKEKDVVAVTAEKDGSSTTEGGMSARFKKLQELKQRRQTEVEEGNRRDRNEEFQRSKINPREEAKVERKRREAEILLARKQAEEAGEDWERKRAWNYSAEAVEKWEERQEKKAKRAENDFTDYGQLAQRKYEKLIDDLKPDLTTYNEHKAAIVASHSEAEMDAFYGDANAIELAGANAQPSRQAVDRLVADVNKQIEKRESRSRKRKEVEDGISWINERNRVFNQKIARFYDKYTKEIRENFERGTAL